MEIISSQVGELLQIFKTVESFSARKMEFTASYFPWLLGITCIYITDMGRKLLDNVHQYY